jgi:hypothetical protein
VSISISSRKAKGRRLQQYIANKISEITGIPWGQDELISSREMGQGGTDVRLIGKARELFPFSVECKSQEKWSIHAWIKQAKDNIIEGTDWILFSKRNREKPTVTLDADVLFEIYGELIRRRNDKSTEDNEEAV